jgi:hypothetical protein
MDNSKTQLTIFGKTEEFDEIQNLLYKEAKIDAKEAEFLFAIAQVLIQKYESELMTKESTSSMYIDYAYNIIARTCFKINDFIALYDFAVNYGYYPIANKINSLNLIEHKSVNFLLSNIGLEQFTVKKVVYTFEQYQNIFKVIKSNEKKIGFIAPTSYGKSKLIFEHLKENNKCNIVAIIVPTKSLIDQVFHDAKKMVKDRKFIIHDQDFDLKSDARIIAIITQERAVRMQSDGLKFDLLYIDEAHELLKFNFRKKFNNRALVLTRLIRIARQKNPNLIEIYLTPMLNTVENLKIAPGDQENTYNIQQVKIKKDLKILDIKFLDSKAKCYVYDKFVNRFFPLQQENSVNEYVVKNSKEKNLHFLYKPRFIESYASDLYNWLSKSGSVNENIPNEISQLIDEIKSVIHDDYKVAKFLKAGIVYLHGKLPDLIRNYLLKFVRESKYIRHFVANSVVLAGMNLPIDNLFYVAGNADTNDMFNLIGRVNRLNEIFSLQNNNLKKIFIPIHFLDIPKYPQFQNGSLEKKIEKLRDETKDKVKNPLLMNFNNSENKDIADKIIKFENDVVTTFDEPDDEAKLLKAGAQQLLNYTESGMRKLITRIKKWSEISETNNFLDTIRKIFFEGFTETDDFEPEQNVQRLSNIEATKYYDTFIKRKQYPFPQRVDDLVKFWSNTKSELIYIGRQYGEVSYKTDGYKKSENVYVNLNDHLHDKEYLNNLAIIKLQIDDEFVDYEVMLLLNTLKEFKIISQDNLDLYFYGTNDKRELKLLKRGISHFMFNKIKVQNLLDDILFDKYDNPVANDKLRKFIDQQTGIEKFELNEFFIS